MTAKVVIGLGFGDEGKGTIVDNLTQRAHSKPLVIRFSGGAQAAHNVINENGFHHTFSQFGSGTLRHAPTLLSRYVLVDPLRLYAESLHLNDFLGRAAMALVAVDERAPLVTRIHQAINHARERARGNGRHGSTGLGMGETELYRITFPGLFPTIGDLNNPEILRDKLKYLKGWGEEQVGELGVSLDSVFEELEAFAGDKILNILDAAQANKLVANTDELIFEGSQGVLLDEWIGFHPNTTWSTLTADNALAIMAESGNDSYVEKLGVTRTYTTRHGAGPFPTEANELGFPELHNTYGEFQGDWRVGHLDLTLLAYAARAVQPDSIAITHMDVEQEKAAVRYDELFDFSGNVENSRDKEWQAKFTEKLGSYTPDLFDVSDNKKIRALIEKASNAQASILSYGPESNAKRWLEDRDGFN